MQGRRAIGTAAWLLGCVVVAGCGDDGGGGGSVTLDEYGAGTAAATCEIFEECYGTDLLETFAGADCVGRFSRIYDEAVVPQLEAAIAAGTITYDGGRAAACLDALESAGCGIVDRMPPPPCDEALVGTVAPGGACALNEECSGDSYCRIEAACPGTCQARVSSGAPCSADDACQAGLRCFDGACQAAAGEGAACGGPSGIECAGGLVCIGAQDAGAGTPGRTGNCQPVTTVQIGAVGDLCDFQGGMLCQPGLSCALTGVSGGTTPVFECVAAASSGGTCNLGFPDPCPFDHTCEGVMPGMGDFEGTCTPLPGAGEPCRSGRCADGTRCASDDTCRTVQGLGGACTEDADCFSGYCDAGACAEAVLCTER